MQRQKTSLGLLRESKTREIPRTKSPDMLRLKFLYLLLFIYFFTVVDTRIEPLKFQRFNLRNSVGSKDGHENGQMLFRKTNRLVKKTYETDRIIPRTPIIHSQIKVSSVNFGTCKSFRIVYKRKHRFTNVQQYLHHWKPLIPGTHTYLRHELIIFLHLVRVGLQILRPPDYSPIFKKSFSLTSFF